MLGHMCSACVSHTQDLILQDKLIFLFDLALKPKFYKAYWILSF
jgi:hypothetical protein